MDTWGKPNPPFAPSHRQSLSDRQPIARPRSHLGRVSRLHPYTQALSTAGIPAQISDIDYTANPTVVAIHYDRVQGCPLKRAASAIAHLACNQRTLCVAPATLSFTSSDPPVNTSVQAPYHASSNKDHLCTFGLRIQRLCARTLPSLDRNHTTSHFSDTKKFEVFIVRPVIPIYLVWIENAAYDVYRPSWDGCSHSAKQPSHGVAGSGADRV